MPKIIKNGIDYSKLTHVMNKTVNNYTNSRADVLYTRTLSAEDDLNSITDSGIYGILNGQYPINIPNIEYIYNNTNYTCSLTVQKTLCDIDNNYEVSQTLIVNCPENPITFLRTYHSNSNTWDYWRNDSNSIMTINNSEKSIVDIAKVLGQGTHNVRMREASGSPYGDTSNDFIYIVFNTVYNSNIDNENFNWCRIIAFDSRSTKMYKKSILNGVDYGWKFITAENTIELGTITDSDKILLEGTDFNNIIESGQYIVSSNSVAASCINIPNKDTAGTLFVTDYSGSNNSFDNNYVYRTQTYITYNMSCIYTRFISKDDSDNNAIIYDNWKSTMIGSSSLTINGTYDSLESFIQATNNPNTNYNHNGCLVSFHDTTGWGPMGVPFKQYRGYVIYQNAYSDQSEYSLQGSLILQNIDEVDGTHAAYYGAITGNKAGSYFTDGVNVTWKRIAFEDVVQEVVSEVSSLALQNRMMLAEKAVVVIEGDEYSSLEEFVIATDTRGETDNANGKFVIFTDTTGWGPAGIENMQYRGYVIYQEYCGDEITNSVDGNITLYNDDNSYTGFITGNKSTGFDAVWSNTKDYVDSRINDLVNGAPEALDTLKELSDAITENEDIVEALNSAIGDKANEVDLTAHTNNKNNPHGVTASQIGAVSKGSSVPAYTIGSSGISAVLSSMNITVDNTFDEVYQILRQNNNQFENNFLIVSNSNDSNFNKSLPVQTGCIIECVSLKSIPNRCIFKLYNFRDNDVYVNSALDGTLNGWVKISRSDEHNIKTYTSLEQLGTTKTDITTWAGLIPNDSQLVMTLWNSDAASLYDKGLIPNNEGGALIAVNAGGKGYIQYVNGTGIFINSSGSMASGFEGWRKLANNADLVNFMDKINRDYYGTNNMAPSFDLMPEGKTNTSLSRLGSCYISDDNLKNQCHAPDYGYAFAFGESVNRYGILFISINGKVYSRNYYSNWTEVVTGRNLTPQSIELNKDGTLSDFGGFIDFHYAGDSKDYTSRIIEDTSGNLNVNGVNFKLSDKSVNASKLLINNTDINNIFAKASEYKIKTYTGFSQIGVTDGSETINDIGTKMPNYSMLIVEIGASHAKIYPEQYGTLFVTKNYDSRVNFKFQAKQGPNTWLGGFANNGNNNYHWSGWSKVALTSDLSSYQGLSSTIITTATDLNTIKTTGMYHIKTNGCTNIPVNNWGTLFVSYEGTPYQIFISDYNYYIYKRIGNANSGNWGDWRNMSATTANYLNGSQFSTLKAFVEATATDHQINHAFRFKDTTGWTPAADWYRCWVQYQNACNQSQYDIGGNVILIDSKGVMYTGSILGHQTKDYTVTWNKLATSADIDTLKTSFQAGCSKIATAITNNGVSTATNASPDTMATNIATLATNKYNAGVTATKKGTAVAANVLIGTTFTSSSGVGISGTMPSNGAVSGSITTSGGTYTIPAGYHNGSGKVTGPTLASLIGTSVTLASNANLLTGNTAYGKNGTLYTGAMENRGAVSGSITTSGGTYTIPAGYHNGSGKVTGPTLASLIGTSVSLDGTAYLLKGKSAYGKNGTRYDGAMTDQGAKTATLNTSTTSYTIPAGYHNGSGKVSISVQEKSNSLNSGSLTITPDSGKLLSKVVITGPTSYSNTTVEASAVTTDDDYMYLSIPSNGYYTTGSKVKAAKIIESAGPTFISLGSGTSFNVSSYSGYQNFTTKNFVITNVTFNLNTTNNKGLDKGGYTATGTGTVKGTYNSSTGKFTVSVSGSANNEYMNATCSVKSATVYLVI